MRWVTTAALAAALVAAAPAHAAGKNPSSVVMVGEAGDYVAPGLRLFQGADQVRASGSDAGFQVGVQQRKNDFGFTLNFGAGSGDLLAPGDYANAQRTPFAEKGHPGIDISGDGRGCNTQAGRFLVKDIDVQQNKLSRLWVLFEQHCEGGDTALFGEIKVNEPPRPGAVRVLPTALRWPPRKVGKRGTTVPFTFIARRSATVGKARVRGNGRRAFTVTADKCRGRHLHKGDDCRVYVRFMPRRTGTARAVLHAAGAAAQLIGDTRVPKSRR